MSNTLFLGCIADDFTGASDAASFLVKGGLRTVLFNGIPEKAEQLRDVDAAVIALKTRTQETAAAAADSLAAAKWLRAQGAEQLYSKYCSTFDSTDKGNIGPIADALLELTDSRYTLLVPSLPANGRTVRGGCLYVNGVPLAESSMRNHPLTPMRRSRLAELMEKQSRYGCLELTREDLARDGGAAKIAAFAAGREHFYLVPDYETDEDAAMLVESFGELPLLTGGSGLLEELARHHAGGGTAAGSLPGIDGRALVLAGSCSTATLAQIHYFQRHGGSSLRLDPAKLLDGSQTMADIWSYVVGQGNQPILLYSSADAAYLDSIRDTSLTAYSQVLEQTMARLAGWAVRGGFTRIIVAGGETSGAVTKGLGFTAYRIGSSAAPGVPVMMPCAAPELRLVLKSGNFGQEDFFARALKLTGKEG